MQSKQSSSTNVVQSHTSFVAHGSVIAGKPAGPVALATSEEIVAVPLSKIESAIFSSVPETISGVGGGYVA